MIIPIHNALLEVAQKCESHVQPSSPTECVPKERLFTIAVTLGSYKDVDFDVSVSDDSNLATSLSTNSTSIRQMYEKLNELMGYSLTHEVLINVADVILYCAYQDFAESRLNMTKDKLEFIFLPPVERNVANYFPVALIASGIAYFDFIYQLKLQGKNLTMVSLPETLGPFLKDGFDFELYRRFQRSVISSRQEENGQS